MLIIGETEKSALKIYNRAIRSIINAMDTIDKEWIDFTQVL